MALCRKILITNPTEEAPVNIKNFLSPPPTFPFTVKSINATPNKEKTTSEMMRKRKPMISSLRAGMENTLAMTTKIPTNAQDTD